MNNYQDPTYSLMLRKLGIKLDEKAKKSLEHPGLWYTFCPQCHDQRQRAHKRQRELKVNLGTGCYACYNCGWQGRMDTDQYLARKREHEERKQQYVKSRSAYRAKMSGGAKLPAATPQSGGTDTHFSPDVLRYLTHERGIPEAVLHEAHVGEALEKMPQTGKAERCIVFNYYEQGMLINQKFRSLQKAFKMHPGGELIPYNIDAILDTPDCIITEGEMDALSFQAVGLRQVISLPSGANANTSWMNRFWDTHFAHKERIYIATDMDAPGQLAAAELAKRLGEDICYRITFSAGCKDANEELTSLGPDRLAEGMERLRQRYREAQPLPLSDIQTLADFEQDLDTLYTLGPQEGQHTGWRNLDEAVSFGLGQLALITGRTNDGKSEWLDELVLRLMLRTGWNTGYWTPENTQLDHCQKIIEKLANRHFHHDSQTGVQPSQYGICKRWMADHMAWIDLRSSEQKLDHLLERARMLVRKLGIKMLVVDPFNFIEKENGAYMSENAWDSHVVGALRDFAMEQHILVFLVAHPRKVEMQLDGRRRRITMEDISGTADFGNKADYCFCIDRDDEHHLVTVSIDKVRRKLYGTKGRQVYFTYNPNSGRYLPCQQDPRTLMASAIDFSDGKMWLGCDLFGNITPTCQMGEEM